MAVDKKARIVFSGVDKFSTTMNRFDAKLAGVQAKMRRFNNGLSSVTRTLNRGFGIALAGMTAAGAGIFAVVKKVADEGDLLAKTSDRLGYTAERLQQIRFAADRTGTPIDQLDKGLEKLNRNLLDVAFGRGEALYAFEQMGISAVDTTGKLRDAEDVLGDIADKFKTVRSEEAKTAWAMQIFGRSGGKLVNMLNLGRDGLQDLYAEFDRLGGGMSEGAARDAEVFTDALTNLKMAMNGVRYAMGGALLPVLADAMNRIARKLGADRAQFEAWGKRVSDALGRAVEGLPEKYDDFKTKMGEVGAVLEEIKTKLRPVTDLFDTLNERVGTSNLLIGSLEVLLAVNLVNALAKITASVTTLTTALSALGAIPVVAATVGAALSLPFLATESDWGKKNLSQVGKGPGFLDKLAKVFSMPQSTRDSSSLIGINLRALGRLPGGASRTFDIPPPVSPLALPGGTLVVDFQNMPSGIRVDRRGARNVSTKEDRDFGRFGDGAFSE
ncbi:phage tail tape measure protein [bacterium]|nr:phage tail tape measure protein [bacterium]